MNISPKVSAAALAGALGTVAVCVAGKYGINLDPGTAAGMILSLMTAAGWVTPHNANGTSTTTTTTTKGVTPQ